MLRFLLATLFLNHRYKILTHILRSRLLFPCLAKVNAIFYFTPDPLIPTRQSQRKVFSQCHSLSASVLSLSLGHRNGTELAFYSSLADYLFTCRDLSATPPLVIHRSALFFCSLLYSQHLCFIFCLLPRYPKFKSGTFITS